MDCSLMSRQRCPVAPSQDIDDNLQKNSTFNHAVSFPVLVCRYLASLTSLICIATKKWKISNQVSVIGDVRGSCIASTTAN